MYYTSHCPNCMANILAGLTGEDKLPANLIWSPPNVLRICPVCGTRVRLFQNKSGKCQRWGPLKWLGVSYCNRKATTVVCPGEKAGSSSIFIDCLCDEHKDERKSELRGAGVSVFLVGSFILASLTALVGLLIGKGVVTDYSTLPILFAQIGFLVGASIPLIFVLALHFKVKNR